MLKGALLLIAWLGETTRPTRDADLLGFGDVTEESLARIFEELCEVEVEPDGLVFLSPTLRVVPIRLLDAYGGFRATLEARLGNARLYVLQVDVGIGDAVTPEPEWLEFPAMLDLPRPRLRAYRPETSIAEKVHTMVLLGEANSRMRDFSDVFQLAQHLTFDGDVLARALRATFERRDTPLPAGTPVALTPAFAGIEGKQRQWAGVVRRGAPDAAPADLAIVIREVARFVVPVLAAAAQGEAFRRTWPAGGPWEASS